MAKPSSTPRNRKGKAIKRKSDGDRQTLLNFGSSSPPLSSQSIGRTPKTPNSRSTRSGLKFSSEDNAKKINRRLDREKRAQLSSDDSGSENTEGVADATSTSSSEENDEEGESSETQEAQTSDKTARKKPRAFIALSSSESESDTGPVKFSKKRDDSRLLPQEIIITPRTTPKRLRSSKSKPVEVVDLSNSEEEVATPSRKKLRNSRKSHASKRISSDEGKRIARRLARKTRENNQLSRFLNMFNNETSNTSRTDYARDLSSEYDQSSDNEDAPRQRVHIGPEPDEDFSTQRMNTIPEQSPLKNLKQKQGVPKTKEKKVKKHKNIIMSDDELEESVDDTENNLQSSSSQESDEEVQKEIQALDDDFAGFKTRTQSSEDIRRKSKREQYRSGLQALLRKKNRRNNDNEIEVSDDDKTSEDENLSNDNEDSLDSFIEDDEADGLIGAPVELPDEFSSKITQPLSHHFKVMVQYEVHRILNKYFLKTLNENESENAYFTFSIQQVEKKMGSIKDSVLASMAWKPNFMAALSAKPQMSYRTILSEPGCDACSLGGRSATYAMKFKGPRYNKKTLKPITRKAAKKKPKKVPTEYISDSSDNLVVRPIPTDDTLLRPSPRKKTNRHGHDYISDEGSEDLGESEDDHEWKVGRYCFGRAQITHRFVHWRFRLAVEITEHLERMGYTTEDKKGKEKVKHVDLIVEKLDSGFTERLWKRFNQEITNSEKFLAEGPKSQRHYPG